VSQEQPTAADPEVAGATLLAHIEALWATGRPDHLGWRRWHPDPMHVMVEMPATRVDGVVDRYLLRLGAKYYDAFPPTVAFMRNDVEYARQGTKWFPTIADVPWFGLHDVYTFPDASVAQLVCFSVSVEYYISNHRPEPQMKWQQGRHTVAATLYRLAEVLQAPFYRGPSGVDA
jgi:hypothetical protein